MSAVATLSKSALAKKETSSGKSYIKDQIQVTLSDVQATRQENQNRLRNLRSLISSWEENLTLVSRKIADAKASKPDAVHSLEVLEDQAKRYVLGYAKQLEDEEAYGTELEGSIPKLTATLRQLEAIDKVTLLDEKLQKLTAGTDIANDRLAITNTRDIQVLLHTAQALVELKKGK